MRTRFCPLPILTAFCLSSILLFAPRPAHADDDPALIVLYEGIGTTKRARIWGRVLEDKGDKPPKRDESLWRRVKRGVQSFESDEIEDARLTIEVLGKKHRVISDEEGLFRLDLRGPLPVGRHPVKATLHDDERTFRVAPASLQVFPAKPGVAVISDIDDTVLDSKVRSKRKLVWKVLTSNARRLKTFDGAPALYRALEKKGYPIAFVSGSPINLYTRLRRFFGLRKFPPAPLLLKNLGRGEKSDSLFEQKAYKLKRIAELAQLLPGYALILIGDSGEKDPEIYAEVAKRWPKRVKAILIHDVTGEKPDAPRFAGQLLFKRYAQAARRLKKLGLVE